MNIADFHKYVGTFGLTFDGFHELSKIADKFGTDKGFLGGRGHLYTQFYGKLFENIRFGKFNLVELGILSGEHQRSTEQVNYEKLYAGDNNETFYQYPSLSMWAEYFPFVNVYGLDKENFIIDDRDRRIHFHKFNADNPKNLVPLLQEIQPMIMLDDASHIFKHQQDVFFHSFEYLKPGGIYVIEDLNSALGDYIDGYPPTEEIFRQGIDGLRLSPSYKENQEKAENMLKMIETCLFSNSFQTGSANTIAIKKKASK